MRIINPFHLSVVVFIILAVGIMGAYADCTIVLKDGRTIESEFCQETDTGFVYHKYGSDITIDRARVESFSRTETEKSTVENVDNPNGEKEVYKKTVHKGGDRLTEYALKGYLKKMTEKYNKFFHLGGEMLSILSNNKSELTEEERLLLMLEWEPSKRASADKKKEQYEYSLKVQPAKSHVYKKSYDRRIYQYYLVQLAIKRLIDRNKANPEVGNIVNSFTAQQAANYDNAEWNLRDLAKKSEYIAEKELDRHI